MWHVSALTRATQKPHNMYVRVQKINKREILLPLFSHRETRISRLLFLHSPCPTFSNKILLCLPSQTILLCLQILLSLLSQKILLSLLSERDASRSTPTRDTTHVLLLTLATQKPYDTFPCTTRRIYMRDTS